MPGNKYRYLTPGGALRAGSVGVDILSTAAVLTVDRRPLDIDDFS
jgi:hypothetical protein